MSMDKLVEQLRKLGRVRLNEPMSSYTTFKCGGPADIHIVPHNLDSIQHINALLCEQGIPRIVIGGGSNLLVSDNGIRGAVLMIGDMDPGNGYLKNINENSLFAAAPISKKAFLQFCVENGFSGMEFLAGIPGCIGGGIVMNAGTDRATFSDILQSVTYINTSGDIIELKITDRMGAYRNLVIPDMAIILSGIFELKKTDTVNIVKMEIEELLEDRKQKHPLDYPSAGSIFKNPEGHSSWKLIDKAGLKGTRLGGAQISELHTNFIINYDNASSQDIHALIKHAQETVFARFGVELNTEIRMIGEF